MRVPGKTVVLTELMKQKVKKLGLRIKNARLRRNIKAELLARQAGISEGTLYAIEKGKSTVSFGAYAAVFQALGMTDDLDQIGLDEKGKQEYREVNICRRERAGKEYKEIHN